MKDRLFRKELVLIIIILFVGASVVPMVMGTNGSIIYVDDDGGADYTCIQDAIDNAADGDTIYVFNGTYNENIVIDKTIYLIGENRDSTIINGAGDKIAVHFIPGSEGSNISGFKIINHNEWGIYVKYNENAPADITIYENNFYDCFGPIRVEDVNRVYIFDNRIENCGHTIIDDCNVFEIRNCVFTNNWHSQTIYLNWADDGIVSGNLICNNSGEGIHLDFCENDIIIENTIRDNGGDGGIFIRRKNLGAPLNLFYHNNIINNGPRNAKDDVGKDIWDNGYPSGGNYWSDYTGQDNYHGPNQDIPGEDGIGDTPYNITGYGSNQDRYPLMSPWSPNSPPVANAGGPYIADEGLEITFNASGSTDPDEDELQYRWDFDNDGTWDTDYSTDPTATYTWYDDYNGTAKVEVYDGEYMDTDAGTVTMNNVAPTIISIDLPIYLVPIGTEVNLTGNFTDLGWLDTHTATIDWGDGNYTNGDITGSDGYYIVTDSWYYAQDGVYTITLTVTDDDDGNDTEAFRYVVVYNPDGGFVTGGGWIDSPSEAYTPDPNLTGKANFGFVSKYKEGEQTPTGNTEFNFKVADMNFHSSEYEWLVIAGPKAMYKGTGAINGDGNYGFMISAVDGQINGGGGVDKFRIKIWDKDNDDNIIYDNNIGADEDADPATILGGGQIKIHQN